jgi:predicted O-methyltransferase YrrM
MDKKRVLRLALTPFWILRFFYYVVKERSWAFLRFYPGYHGSTIPSRKLVEQNRAKLFAKSRSEYDGIDLNRSQQQELLERFVEFFPDFKPSENQSANSLYFYNNSMFGFSDAFTLYGIFREFKPGRVIELGSGFSSALMLDISRELLPGTVFKFIDPYSENIQRVLKSRPEGRYELIRRQAQEIELEFFHQLGENDVLFIDTSHSLKIGSDLSTIFFSILPALKPGVLVHIHDIYFPWEYPEDMVLEGRTYNEIYFLRAFLQYNNAFKIIYNNSQMELEHPDYFANRMPGYYKASGQKAGQSLWLRKVA